MEALTGEMGLVSRGLGLQQHAETPPSMSRRRCSRLSTLKGLPACVQAMTELCSYIREECKLKMEACSL